MVTSGGTSTLALGGSFDASFDVSQIGGAARYQGFGAFQKTGTSTWTLTNTTTVATLWTISQGTLSAASDASLGDAAGALTFNGGILQVTGATFTSTARMINWGAGGGGFDIASSANTFAVSQTLSGPGGLTKLGAGTLTLSATNTYRGVTTVSTGTLQAGAADAFGSNSAVTVAAGATLGLNDYSQSIGSLAGAGNVTLGSGTLTAGGDNASTTFSGTISGSGGLTKQGAGTTTLSGTNTYTGATTVSGGTLEVNGAIASSNVTVNPGATLSGTGTVGDPIIAAGGTLSPGSTAHPYGTLTITDPLTFASGSFYTVHVSPSANSWVNVTGATGTATLGGATVNAIWANGSYVAKQYTILNASGGVSGTFSSLVDTNLPANFHTSLSYDANNAYLDLTLNFVPPNSGLNANQQAVGHALTNYFDGNGGIPLVYGGLTAAGLTQASGELGASSQQTTFQAMGQFIGLLTDPFMARNGGPGSTGGAPGFAEAASGRTDAFAMFSKAAQASFEQRWSVWAAGFGGSQSTDGHAATGSNTTTSNIYGTAVGADHLLSPNTLAGFSLAGGGTNFSVNGLGSGRSDLFQAGAYVRHTHGQAYISAALAYGWQHITTDRSLTIAGVDHLRAAFDANAWSGRVEGGYRLVAPWTNGIGITPYLAGQFTTFDLPSYAEQAISGAGNFALTYAAKRVTDARSELGLRTDKSFALADGVLTLRGRLGWAHDFNPARSIAATFQALPGASFVVGGAAQASDSALASASLDMKWMTGWSAAATFEGEFANVTSSYAGKGVVRYAW